MVDWNGLNEFVAVAETGSFTGAAKQLGLSTAHISRQVGELETRLSVRLFNRTTRKVSITDHGRIFYNRCRQIQTDFTDAKRHITGLQDIPHGKLRVTAPIVYGQDIVAPVLNDFLLKYPELDVELNLTNETIDLVEEGYDLAIRLGKLKDSSMTATKLTSRTMFVCGAPSYFERHAMPEKLTDLNAHNCLVGSLNFWKFRDRNKAKAFKVSGSLRCNSGWALLDAASKGIGLVQLPDYYVTDHINEGKLLPILEQFRDVDEGIWSVYPHRMQLSPNVRLFIEHLKCAL